MQFAQYALIEGDEEVSIMALRKDVHSKSSPANVASK